LAEQAVGHLQELHRWVPTSDAKQTLSESLDHGGFVSQAALFAELNNLATVDRLGIVPGHLLDGLVAVAETAPPHARAVVPVHADCHWGNWLARDANVTALLDFEWARLGEPVDDWFFLIRFSGPHMEVVLDVISHATDASEELLRAQCEVREAAHLASDLRLAIERTDTSSQMAVDRFRALEELVVGRYWWRRGR
jgi:aminoglycoside phosphotransferase (APT) family kinase protein